MSGTRVSNQKEYTKETINMNYRLLTDDHTEGGGGSARQFFSTQLPYSKIGPYRHLFVIEEKSILKGCHFQMKMNYKTSTNWFSCRSSYVSDKNSSMEHISLQMYNWFEFSFHILVAIPRLKSPVCPTIYF